MMKLVEVLNSAKEIAGGESFSDLGKNKKQQIFDLLMSSAAKISYDGDKDRCYSIAHFDNIKITISSRCEDCDEIRDYPDYMWFDTEDGDQLYDMQEMLDYLSTLDISPYAVGITHSGVFHADDVFSAALLDIVSPGIEIKRVSRVPDNVTDDTIIFDIGGGQFDHHQEGAEVRDNGVPYAAFGLLWREFGHSLCGNAADNFDRCFVQPLDHADNGGAINPMSMAISAFMPNWDDADQDMDAAFFRAVELAQGVLTRQIRRINASAAAKSIVVEAAANARSNIAVLDRFVPWDTVLPDTDIDFVVFPSLRGGWTAQAVPTTPSGRDQKIPFPPRDILTANVSGITFCHTGRFLISTETKAAAINACEFASEQ